jgi:Mce-associated membrane protein
MTDEAITSDPAIDADVENGVDIEIDAAQSDDTVADTPISRRTNDRLRLLAFGVLPAVVIVLGAGAGFLRWQESSHRAVDSARIESMAAARDATVAILSYKADSVERDLHSARDHLTGNFLESFSDLVDKVVIPGAKEKRISTTVQVPDVASVSATANHAVVLAFVDQTATMGDGAPSGSASSVRVTLDKVDGRWLVSGFDPV